MPCCRASARRSQPSGQTGFVLPGVLAFIAAFTFIILTTAVTLERSRNLAVALERQQQLVAALDAAEAEATYLYMTGRGVVDAIELLPRERAVTDIVLGQFQSPPPEEEEEAEALVVWPATGGLLLLDEAPYRTWAIYRDVSGLLSLSSGRAEIISDFLEEFDVDSSEADQLAARLRDYQDEDRLRRPLGAERADYRLRQMALPTDSPLRNPAELARVMGWEDLDFINDLEFLAHVTAAMTGDQPVLGFAPDRLKLILANQPVRDASQIDPLTLAANLSLVPRNRARFTLFAQDISTGELKVRLVEIERQPGAATAPYSRSFIAEFTDPFVPESWFPPADAQVAFPPQPEDL